MELRYGLTERDEKNTSFYIVNENSGVILLFQKKSPLIKSIITKLSERTFLSLRTFNYLGNPLARKPKINCLFLRLKYF